MTKDRDFKKAVRSRAAKTGESYAAARAKMTRPKPRSYNFDSLSVDAKRALAAAEELARGAGSDAIRLEHLVRALVSLRSSGVERWKHISGQPDQLKTGQLPAAQVDDEPVPGSTPGAPLPSVQLRRVLEEAFASAGRQRQPHVGVSHLLEGIGRVRPQSPVVGWLTSWGTPEYSPELVDLLERAQQRAGRGGMAEVRIEDVLAELNN